MPPKMHFLDGSYGLDIATFDNHEFVMVLTDQDAGLRAYIAIHNTNRGPALGGTRIAHYATERDALEDALNLSRAMSYKCALAQLPYGGGKGVIVANETVPREQLLHAYARLVEKLGGLFRTGTDVGVTDDDVKVMAKDTSYMLGVVPGDRGELTTAKVAALGVFYAMKAALTQLTGSAEFSGKKIAVKGVGKLGGELTRLVTEAGAQAYVADVNAKACEALQKAIPAVTILPVDDIARQEVDIYAPCALGNEFTSENIERLQCKAIVGGANNQLANEEVADEIAKRGILYAPDYIANAGGLIYVADELEPGGFNRERVLRRTKGIEETMQVIFGEAHKQKSSASAVADSLARARIGGKTA